MLITKSPCIINLSN